MEIKASMVKELRDLTGAGMMDAKKALVEAEGDMERAQELLRQKGIASADKKMGRIAAEGLVGSVVEGKRGALVEINCETDFVAKNEDFKALLDKIAKVVLDTNPADVDALNATSIDGTTVEEVVKAAIAKIGEKITIRRFVRYDDNNCVATYVHNSKIGVLLEVKADACTEENRTIAKDICLHIASSAPEFVSREQIPADVIAEEKRIEMGKEDLANKPENIREKTTIINKNKVFFIKAPLFKSQLSL